MLEEDPVKYGGKKEAQALECVRSYRGTMNNRPPFRITDSALCLCKFILSIDTSNVNGYGPSNAFSSYILNTPNASSPDSSFTVFLFFSPSNDNASPSTSLVSLGMMIPSSHNLAVEYKAVD